MDCPWRNISSYSCHREASMHSQATGRPNVLREWLSVTSNPTASKITHQAKRADGLERKWERIRLQRTQLAWPVWDSYVRWGVSDGNDFQDDVFAGSLLLSCFRRGHLHALLTQPAMVHRSGYHFGENIRSFASEPITCPNIYLNEQQLHGLHRPHKTEFGTRGLIKVQTCQPESKLLFMVRRTLLRTLLVSLFILLRLSVIYNLLLGQKEI